QEETLPEIGDHELTTTASRNFRKDARDHAPVTCRLDHILADTERGHGVLATKEPGVLRDATRSLGKPGVAEGKRLMTSEGAASDLRRDHAFLLPPTLAHLPRQRPATLRGSPVAR